MIGSGVAEAVPGAAVEVGPLDVSVDSPLASTRLGAEAWLEADRTCAVLHVPAVARFGVEQGHRVVVEPADGAAPDELEDWMRGLVAPLLLAQRGRFALHANLVELGGVAVAVAGARGAGKTTTSLVLAQRGGRVLGDDVLLLARGEDGGVAYATTGRPLRVAPEVAAALELDVSGAPRGGRDGKILMPRPAGAPGALHAVTLIRRAPIESVTWGRLAGTEAIRALLLNVYRLRLLRPIWRAELFEWAGAVAGRVPVHVVRRPAAGWSVDDVAAAVESLATENGRG